MQTTISFILTVSMLISLYGCHTIKVSAEYDEQKNFAQIRTFDWLSRLQKGPEQQDKSNPFLKQKIQRAIEDSLAAQGIKRQDSGAVDIYIEFYGKTRKDTYVSTTRHATSISSGYTYDHSGYDYSGNRYSSGRYYGPTYETTITYGPREEVLNTITVGSLVIDVIDASSNELIWRSIAQAEIDQWDQETKKDKAVKAVGKIMSRFPPK